MSEIDDRLDRLESQLDQQQQRIDDQQATIEDQQATIESQQATIEEQREQIADLKDDDSTAATDAESTVVNRRNALKAGGLLALLFGSAGTASADSQGQVGTSSDPLNALYTAELHGDVTNDQSLTNLTGNGLTISSGSLDIESGAIDSAELASDSVTVAGNSVPLGSSTDVNYVDLADTGSSFPIPNSDIANSSVTVTAGYGLKNGGSASLGGSTTLDVEPADFAGATLEDDVSDNLTVSSGSIGTNELATDFSTLAALFGRTPKVGGSGSLTANSIVAASDQNDGKLFLQADEEISIEPDSTTSTTLTFGAGTTIGASLEPDSNGVYFIGSSSSRWDTIYLTTNPNVSSDARLKESITELTDGLDRLEQVRPVSYEWKDREDPDRRLGFIAQELEDAVPEAVTHPDDDAIKDADEGGDDDGEADSDEDGYLGVTYEMVLPVAVDAIQTQQERIEELEAENEQLRERVAAIEERIDVDESGEREVTADD